MAERGTISINAENIMPVIKKWLYSRQGYICARSGLQRLRRGEQDEAPDLHGEAKLADGEGDAPWRVDVVANAEEGTLAFSDNGIGMTAEEVRKYIAQVAFSGAEEFLKSTRRTTAPAASSATLASAFTRCSWSRRRSSSTR